jgi:hypothetical protein
MALERDDCPVRLPDRPRFGPPPDLRGEGCVHLTLVKRLVEGPNSSQICQPIGSDRIYWSDGRIPAMQSSGTKVLAGARGAAPH